MFIHTTKKRWHSQYLSWKLGIISPPIDLLGLGSSLSTLSLLQDSCKKLVGLKKLHPAESNDSLAWWADQDRDVTSALEIIYWITRAVNIIWGLSRIHCKQWDD